MATDKSFLGIAIRLAFSPRDKDSSSYAIFLNKTLPISEYGGRCRGSTVFPTNLKIQKKYKDRLKRVLFFTPDLSLIYEGNISGIIDDYEWKNLKRVLKCIDDARRISRNLSNINSDLMSTCNKVQEMCRKPQGDESNQKNTKKREDINSLQAALDKFLERNIDPRNIDSDQQGSDDPRSSAVRITSMGEFFKLMSEQNVVDHLQEAKHLQEVLDEFSERNNNDPQFKKVLESIECLRRAIRKLLKRSDMMRAASGNWPVDDVGSVRISDEKFSRHIEKDIAVSNNNNPRQTMSELQLRVEVWENIEHLQEVLKKSLREGDGSLQGTSFTLMEIKKDLQEERSSLKKIKNHLKEMDGFLQNICEKDGNEQERTGTIGENLSIAMSNISDALPDIEEARKLIVKFREGDNSLLVRINVDSIRRKMDGAAQNISSAAREAENTDAYPKICQRYAEADMSSFTRVEYLSDAWIIIENLKKIKPDVLLRYYVYGTMYSLADKMREPAFPRTYYTNERNSAQHKDSKNSKYKYCPWCGKYLLREDFIYCPYCGKSLHNAETIVS